MPGCDEWFHGVCVGVKPKMLGNDSVFRCAKCSYAKERMPELERPSTWKFRLRETGQNPSLDVYALTDLFVKTPSGNAQISSNTFASVPVPRRDYVLLLGNRRVALWDLEHQR